MSKKKKNINHETLLIDGFTAVAEGDIQKLEQQLKKGLSPNAEDEDKLSLLQAAMETCNPEIVNLLLEKGADPNKAKTEKMEIQMNNDVLNLSEEIDDSNSTEPEIKKVLSFEIENVTPLISAILIPDELQEEKSSIIDSLIAYGADVNKADIQYGITPMHIAAATHDISSIEKLATNGGNVNAIALKDYVRQSTTMYNTNVTPMLMAISPESEGESGKCIDTLMKYGADVKINANEPGQMGAILRELGEFNNSKAEKLVKEIIDEDSKKLNYNDIQNKVSEFLKKDSTKASELDNCVEDIFFPGVENKKQLNYVKYYGHLNSWTGNVSGSVKDKENSMGAEGWNGYLQSPVKIKSLLLLLKRVEDGKIDCPTTLNEPKESIVKKIRDEIFNQTSTYYTDANGDMLQNLTELGKPKSSLEYNANVYMSKNWADKIGNLKDGESFCFGGGTLDHQIFMEYKKQPRSEDLSQLIYNLGGGITEYHPVSLENRVFPYIVKDIPQEMFKGKDFTAVDYLNDLLIARKTLVFDEEGLAVTFKKIYEKPMYAMKGQELSSVDGLVPSKQQISGNCAFKNNLTAINNRFNNSKLFKALKITEKALILNHVDIPIELIKRKELEKDLENLDYIINLKSDNKDSKKLITESELWKFLGKRAEKIPESIAKKEGDRIAYAIKHLKDPNVFENYIASKPVIISKLREIGNVYKSKELLDIADKSSKKYVVTSDLYMSVLERNRQKNPVQSKEMSL